MHSFVSSDTLDNSNYVYEYIDPDVNFLNSKKSEANYYITIQLKHIIKKSLNANFSSIENLKEELHNAFDILAVTETWLNETNSDIFQIKQDWTWRQQPHNQHQSNETGRRGNSYTTNTNQTRLDVETTATQPTPIRCDWTGRQQPHTQHQSYMTGRGDNSYTTNTNQIDWMQRQQLHNQHQSDLIGCRDNSYTTNTNQT